MHSQLALLKHVFGTIKNAPNAYVDMSFTNIL